MVELDALRNGRLVYFIFFSILDTDLYISIMVTTITVGVIISTDPNPTITVTSPSIGFSPPSPRPHDILKPSGVSPLSYPMQCGSSLEL